MLGSGQAAGMALGSSTHTGMSSGLNTSSSPLAMGAARYLAGLGMGTGVSFLALHFCTSSLLCCMGTSGMLIFLFSHDRPIVQGYPGSCQQVLLRLWPYPMMGHRLLYAAW